MGTEATSECQNLKTFLTPTPHKEQCASHDPSYMKPWPGQQVVLTLAYELSSVSIYPVLLYIYNYI